MRSLCTLVFALLAACGSDSTPKQIDAPKSIDAPSGGGMTALTVKNYLNWCSVTVGNGTATTGATQTVDVTPGAITLKASPASSSFEIAGNMWHHTDADTGSGETGTVTGSGTTAVSTATVTVGATAKCVWVCCPFTNGTGCDGIAEQCP